MGVRLTVATACFSLVVGLTAVAGSSAPAPGQWRPLASVPGIVDVAGPRRDGRLVLATRGGLVLLRPGSSPQPFARGPGGYVAAGGEPYVALGTGIRPSGADCTFRRDEIYALDASAQPGVVRIDRLGHAARLVDFPAGSFPSGITLDGIGRFGYRLLVTVVAAEKTTLYAMDCSGRSSIVAQGGPRVEGGIAVAPRSFGRFAGELIAPDELSGRIFAFGPQGRVRLVVASGLPAGGDIGVEGVGFVPTRLGARGAAYFADLGAPGSPTEGSDSLLVLRGQDLARASMQPGELVAATEAGARTIAVRCTTRCTVRHVGAGPVTAHGEGHVAFVPGG